MTIEEAIEHAREVAEGCPAEDRQCAYQHDELADWLEELKAYRETGLVPEEITDFRENYRIMAGKFADYKAAETTGELVFLPCKVGDLLYEVDLAEYGVIVCKAISVDYYNGPINHIPGNAVIDIWTVETEVIEGHGKGSAYNFEPGDFGKIVFLTREEAEAALKEQEG